MPDATYVKLLSGAGMVLGAGGKFRSADHPNPYGPITLPVALAVTGWTKTDADTATCVEPVGFVAGKYDVYWSGGLRYGVDGTVVGTGGTINLDGGAGTDFPATATTGIVICKQTQINTMIDGDQIAIIGIELLYSDSASTKLGHVDMQDAGSATIAEIDLIGNDVSITDVAGGAVNIFTGNPITKTFATHNDTANTAALRILSFEDATP